MSAQWLDVTDGKTFSRVKCPRFYRTYVSYENLRIFKKNFNAFIGKGKKNKGKMEKKTTL